jgi:hypothetical protein
VTAFRVLIDRADDNDPEQVIWPLPNVWLGVSVEDQQRADERIPDLLETSAAVRFLSCEPLLGPIDLNRLHQEFDDGLGHSWESCLNGKRFSEWGGDDGNGGDIDGVAKIDQVIVGGESGPNARPMHPDWARDLRDQCAAAGVPFLFKQWGEWAPHTLRAGGDLGGDVRRGFVTVVYPTGQTEDEIFLETGGRNTIPGTRYVARVGKKAAGRLLDGRTHDGVPS